MQNKGISTGKMVFLGSNFFAGIGFLGFIGHYLDKKTGHEYKYAIIGAVVGFVWAMYETWKIAFLKSEHNKVNSDEKN
jgi:F0F1-type ATP synthase assembly protein I